MTDRIDEYEIAPQFGTQYAVFYPNTIDGGYLEGGYPLEEAQDMAAHEADAYVVKITVERYQP